jgi:DNA repair protein RadC
MSHLNQCREKLSQYGLKAMTNNELLVVAKYRGNIEDYYSSPEYRAAKELQCRRETPEVVKVKNSEDGFQLFSHLSDLQHEEMWAAFLNRDNRVIKTLFVNKGSKSQSVVNYQEVIRVALDCGASNIIIAHNHPSGNEKPSQPDITITERVKQAASFFEITLLDHIIVAGESRYFSFADNGNL